MICTVCGGTADGGSAHGVWSSAAATSLARETGRTCFCGVSVDQMQSFVEEFETKLEGFLTTHFPGLGLSEIRIKLRTMDRQSTLRVHSVKRISYYDRIKGVLKGKREEVKEFVRQNPNVEQELLERRKKEQFALPSDGPISLSEFALDSKD